MLKFTTQTLTVLMLIILSFGVQSQNKKLVFSNGQQTDIQGNATIDINSGNITVQPIGNKLIVDEPASQKAIIGFYPSEYAIDQGDSIDVNWAVAYTDNTNCSASVTQGSASWSGNKNAGPGIYVQPNVTVSQLPATLRLTCNDYNGGSSFQEFEIVQDQSGGTTSNPTINTFQLTAYPGANPTIPNDGNYNIQWNVSNLTGSCTATSTAFNNGGWTGTISNATGNKNIFIEGEPVLRLICSNGGTQVQRAITVSNTGGSGGGGTPPNCSQVDVWTPPGLTATTWDYTDTYQGGLTIPRAIPGQNGFGAPFYHPQNTAKQMINHINPEQKYIVIENVQVPNEDLDIKFSFTGSPGWGEQGPTTFSMSECPGNFNPSTARCVGQIYANNVLLSTRASVANIMGSTPSFCHLEKGKKYYLNFVFSQPYDGTNINNQLDGPGEECNSAISNGCAIFWGEKAWVPPGS
jgi:hypothetical protein